MLKFDAYRNAPLFFVHKSCILFKCSSQLVVPQITGVFLDNAYEIFSKAFSGVLNSITTSIFDKSV